MAAQKLTPRNKYARESGATKEVQVSILSDEQLKLKIVLSAEPARATCAAANQAQGLQGA